MTLTAAPRERMADIEMVRRCAAMTASEKEGK